MFLYTGWQNIFSPRTTSCIYLDPSRIHSNKHLFLSTTSNTPMQETWYKMVALVMQQCTHRGLSAQTQAVAKLANSLQSCLPVKMQLKAVSYWASKNAVGRCGILFEQEVQGHSYSK